MKHLYCLVTFLLVLPLGSCQTTTPEPDFSGVQNLNFTITAKSNLLLSADAISVHPTIFQDMVYVDVSSLGNDPVVVYVSDEKGKYSKKIELPQGAGEYHTMINFQGMPKGIYVSEVHFNGKVSRYRLVKAN
ncbi:hypothetical protein ACMA1I_01100 [Pontibacter sp. 13R65]|uniref:hypothetical protein n=1 Tax=Pontibacter sp. 13R65 TaxID=3127458 RepID=UPI00301BB85B